MLFKAAPGRFVFFYGYLGFVAAGVVGVFSFVQRLACGVEVGKDFYAVQRVVGVLGYLAGREDLFG